MALTREHRVGHPLQAATRTGQAVAPFRARPPPAPPAPAAHGPSPSASRGHGLVLLHGDEARELLLPPLLDLRGRHRGRHLPRRVPLRETARAPIHAPAATRSAPRLVSDVR